MLATVVCAVLCGARGFSAIAQWIHAQPREVWWVLGYYRIPPTENTFRSLLSRLDPVLLEDALRQWIEHEVDKDHAELQTLAIDGKTLCSTLTAHGRSVQLLALFDAQSGCVLSQMQVPTTTNEAKGALEILKSLVLEGRVVTGDAMFASPEICRAIIDSGGDSLLVVKDNQKELKEAIEGDFMRPPRLKYRVAPRYSA